MWCIFEGCQQEGVHNFSVRLRRPDTSAIWAPNTRAFLCNFHASRGVRIVVLLEPTDRPELETIVRSVGQPVSRKTPIRHTPN